MARDRLLAEVLYQDEMHVCLCFHELMPRETMPSNQCMIIHRGHAAIMDPGGDLNFKTLLQTISHHIDLAHLDFILASHQDPDIITSLPRWLMHTQAQVVIPSVWARFLPHLVSGIITDHLSVQVSDRLIALPDQGGRLSLSDCEIIALPAHFLHSVGNFSFYDPHARILFSGDIGSSTDNPTSMFVQDFEAHTTAMTPFHQRYMCSNQAARHWVALVRQLDITMMIPQHGPGFSGPAMVENFLSWFEELPVGLDLIDAHLYQVPV